MFDSQVPELKWKRIKVFILCFIQYSCVHACRSTWSYFSGTISYDDSKTTPNEDQIEGFTKTYLGYINFVFLFLYGSAMLFIGQIGDKIGPKRFVLYGTMATSIIQLSIAVLFPIEKKQIWLFMFLMALNGVAQASAWPGLMAIMNNWQAKAHKVICMGYFTACTNIGNILGDLYADILVDHLDLPLQTPIYVSSILLFTITVINFFLLGVDTAKDHISIFKNSRTGSLIYKEDHAQYLSRTSSMVDQSSLNDKSLHTVYRDTIGDPILEPNQSIIQKKPKKDSINMVTAWKLPNVAIYAFAFGCIKAVFYILAFWLPSYLKSEELSNVALITQMIEWGTIPGGILICYAGEKWNKRAILIVPSLWLGTGVMMLINVLEGLPINTMIYILYYLFVFLTGLLIGGVYNNISGAIVIELSNMKELKGNKKSTSTVTSVVMGYGAVFAALNQLVVPFVQSFLFVYCSINSVFAGLLLLPIIRSEYKRWKESKKKDLLIYDTVQDQQEQQQSQQQQQQQ